jgi:hypothetical protein
MHAAHHPLPQRQIPSREIVSSQAASRPAARCRAVRGSCADRDSGHRAARTGALGARTGFKTAVCFRLLRTAVASYSALPEPMLARSGRLHVARATRSPAPPGRRRAPGRAMVLV